MAALRGVNLGGWLVTERWMTPALYDGVSGEGERELGRQLGPAEAERRLTEHRTTFITEEDFAWIAGHGFAFVRLPIGYWLFVDPADPTDHYLPGAEHLDQAFTWADRYGLQVLVDLHGLPGSQNGRDHSGEVGVIGWYDTTHTERALGTVTRIAQTYGRHERLLGLELVNEPRLRLRAGRLLRYYDAAYAAAADHLAPHAKIIVSDGYQARRMGWALSRRLRRGRFGTQHQDRVVLDVHLYRLFTWFARRADLDRHLHVVEHSWTRLLRRLSRRLPVLVGEWTAALPGRLVDGVDRSVLRHGLHAFFASQQRVFDEHAWAHAYWSYKTLGDNGAWSLRDAELLPPPTPAAP